MPNDDITLMLKAATDGDEDALKRLLPMVYDSLRRLARGHMAREASDHTLEPTALVHEAYLRLFDGGPATWENRRHFFGAAAEAMRRILIDHARRKNTIKHGGARVRRPLDECFLPAALPAAAPEDLLALNEALEDLATEDPSKAELIKVCFFGGLTLDDAAVVLGLSRTTAHRHWRYARAWLHAAITGGDGGSNPPAK